MAVKTNSHSRISVRCSEELYTGLKRLAAADRRKLADYVRIKLEKLVARSKAA